VDQEMREKRGTTFCSECCTDTGELLYFSPYSQRYVHSICRTTADDPQLSPCAGCDGHECDKGCQYPGAQ